MIFPAFLLGIMLSLLTIGVFGLIGIQLTDRSADIIVIVVTAKTILVSYLWFDSINKAGWESRTHPGAEDSYNLIIERGKQ